MRGLGDATQLVVESRNLEISRLEKQAAEQAEQAAQVYSNFIVY